MSPHYPELSAFPTGSPNNAGIDVRTYVATAIVAGIRASMPSLSLSSLSASTRDEVANAAVEQADALLRRLALKSND